MPAQTTRAPIVVTYEGGVKFAAHIRSHRVVVDQPKAAGGEDTAPSPIELLCAALGTCVAYYVQQFCHARALAVDGLRVEVEPRTGATKGRISQFVVRVLIATELSERDAAMLERVARSCPAHNTLTHGAEVSVHIVAAVEAL